MDHTEQLKVLRTAPSFRSALHQPIKAGKPEILQLNITRKCNLSCRHCHVEASSCREEMMPCEILERALVVAGSNSIRVIDITGGCPELNPHLEWFLHDASKLKKRLIVRTNLVILNDEKFRHFIDVYTGNNVELFGSLPCYTRDNTDSQRGQGSFLQAIDVLRTLNRKGYGKEKSGLVLNLVYNPLGAYLPGSQSGLENDYKRELSRNYGVTFNNLFCLANLPVGRFLTDLLESGKFDKYMDTLVAAFNPKAAGKVMCRNTVNVAYNGVLYDCDFNQMLDLPMKGGRTLMDPDLFALEGREIVLGNHCWGCTAGPGSSCQGATDMACGLTMPP